MKLITRAEWRARRPESRTALVPAFGTTVHYEGPRMGSFPHESCPAKVRGIQAFHMDARGWVDIAYTAIVCPHGYTFEGRWAGVRTAANGTNDGNAAAYAVCLLMGVGDELAAEALAELVDVIDFLDLHAAAGSGANGHRDWKPTACPGEPAYRSLPAIRTALERRRHPAPAPSPAPASIDFPPFEEDDVQTRLVMIALGKPGGSDAGKGWARWDPGLKRAPVIVGTAVNGRDPSTEGYGDNVTPDVAVSVRGTAVVVTAEDGTPGGAVGVFVSVA